jgi:uncharacterized protein (TIGR00369 family)
MPPRSLQALMDRLARGEEFAPPGFADLLVQRLVALEPGRAVVELLPDERHMVGIDASSIFGAHLAAIGSAAMSLAYGTTLEDGETGPTLELTITFLELARPGVALRAVGRVVKSGGVTGSAACDITDATGQLVAQATCTYARIIPPQ